METTDVPFHFKSPSRLLSELGIDEPSEIHIEAIAQYCGATVVYEPLEGSVARLIGFGSRAIITINSHSPPTRRRFSAAHELGHWMWDRGKMAFACAEKQINSESADDRAERRANSYAVDLLLPRSLFAASLAGQALGFGTVQRLAQEFQTSLTATAIRLVELSPVPMLLVCSQNDRRRWYVKSPNLPLQIKPKNEIDERTVAYQVARDPESREIREVSADWWLKETVSDPRLPDTAWEDSLRAGPEHVLSLLWWP